ncbi:hypothetical protein [Sulfuriflexus mobilis]|uniref:hypothetical protein n=1 Tax=Sulfuriflexus mobilis TaxID=1811807 RepID=UPI000F84DFC6|nr:hypothetical protein [Sulfuriflexus mobilis]
MHLSLTPFILFFLVPHARAKDIAGEAFMAGDARPAGNGAEPGRHPQAEVITYSLKGSDTFNVLIVLIVLVYLI